MKWLITLLILGGLGYLAYTHQDEVLEKIAVLRGQTSVSTPTGADSSSPSPLVAASEPVKTFESKIDIPVAEAQPGEKHLAAPGVFYMTERVSLTTPSGIVAVNPGEQVKLLKRLPGDRMTVAAVGTSTEFEIKANQATNDLEVAREAEKKNFVAHGGRL